MTDVLNALRAAATLTLTDPGTPGQVLTMAVTRTSGGRHGYCNVSGTDTDGVFHYRKVRTADVLAMTDRFGQTWDARLNPAPTLTQEITAAHRNITALFGITSQASAWIFGFLRQMCADAGWVVYTQPEDRARGLRNTLPHRENYGVVADTDYSRLDVVVPDFEVDDVRSLTTVAHAVADICQLSTDDLITRIHTGLTLATDLGSLLHLPQTAVDYDNDWRLDRPHQTPNTTLPAETDAAIANLTDITDPHTAVRTVFAWLHQELAAAGWTVHVTTTPEAPYPQATTDHATTTVHLRQRPHTPDSGDDHVAVTALAIQTAEALGTEDALIKSMNIQLTTATVLPDLPTPPVTLDQALTA